MTIRLELINKSSEKTIIASYEDSAMGDAPPSTSPAGEIGPFESEEFYIHDLRSILFKEKK